MEHIIITTIITTLAVRAPKLAAGDGQIPFTVLARVKTFNEVPSTAEGGDFPRGERADVPAERLVHVANGCRQCFRVPNMMLKECVRSVAEKLNPQGKLCVTCARDAWLCLFSGGRGEDGMGLMSSVIVTDEGQQNCVHP